jgi:hypothetical protein
MKIRVCKNFVVDLDSVTSYGFVFFDGVQEASNVIFNYDDEEMDLCVECSHITEDNEVDGYITLTEEQYEKLNDMFMSMLARGASFFDAYSFVKDMLGEK